MSKALFNDLVTSLKEAGRIARGEAPASRRFKLEALDVKQVRKRTGLSQTEFAKLIHERAKTLP